MVLGKVSCSIVVSRISGFVDHTTGRTLTSEWSINCFIMDVYQKIRYYVWSALSEYTMTINISYCQSSYNYLRISQKLNAVCTGWGWGGLVSMMPGMAFTLKLGGS